MDDFDKLVRERNMQALICVDRVLQGQWDEAGAVAKRVREFDRQIDSWCAEYDRAAEAASLPTALRAVE